jgi:Flp pilus assembly protein TadG
MKSALDVRGWHRKVFSRLFPKLLKCNRANIAIMFGLMAPMFIGGLGMGAETALWYADQRNTQNASDAAALAAASDGTAANYANVANAVAAQYGFTNGSNGVTVTSTNTAACPAGGNTCYQVNITMKQELYLLPAVGYSGNTTFNGSPATTIQGAATAFSNPTIHRYCLLTLAGIASSLGTNGAPTGNLAGCSIMSDGGAACNGHNLGADYGDAVLTNNGCGVTEASGVPTVHDPYTYIGGLIPANPCSSYPQEPAKNKDPALPSSNQWTGGQSLSGDVIICGDLQLTGDVTINAPAGARIIIENGQLDTNGYTIATANGSNATLVFSGDNSPGYTHYATGGGTLNIQAPTSGPWSGVVYVQDPKLTNGVDFTFTGNSPTWDITGLTYFPNANITFKGAVNKSSYGASCFVMTAYTLLISGTDQIQETGGCPQAGLAMPTNQVGNRATLVY